MLPVVRSKTVQIVDDAAARTMYREALVHAGCRIVAWNGFDAPRHIEHTIPHVIILDLMLPRAGGAGRLQRATGERGDMTASSHHRDGV